MKKIKDRFGFALYCIVHRLPLRFQYSWQGRNLRRLVAHAYRHVALYRDLLQKAHISLDSIRSLEDIAKLPVTSKQLFKGRMAEEYTDVSRQTYASWYTTSGTDGSPLTFLMGDHTLADRYLDFGTYRFLWWRGEPLRSVFSSRIARIKMRGKGRSDRLLMQVEEFLTEPKTALKKIKEFKPEILSAYPSILLEIARLVKKDEKLSPHPRYILSFGENLPPSTRTFVEEVLEAKIYDRYGLEEIGSVGVECALHDGFHINTESVTIEITDGKYNPLPPGQEGRIIATDLFNYNMPFIRYDTGDRGMISNVPCPCGVPSPRLFVRGRGWGQLSFAARNIHHLEFDAAMDGFMNYIYRYQIAKKSDTRIVARIIPGRSFNGEVPEKVKENLRRLVGSSVHVDVEITDTLPITPRGKSKIIVDESVGASS